VEEVDAVLGGGWPCGRLSELIGPPSSGRTSLLLRVLAASTYSGAHVACVDLADTLHPESAARAGVALQRLLWVRPLSVVDAMRCTELLLQAGGFAVVALDLGTRLPCGRYGRVWMRLFRAAEQSHTALVVLAPQRVAGSVSVLSLQLRPRRACWQRGLWPLFQGFESLLQVTRNKLGPPGGSAVIRARDVCAYLSPAIHRR
jgi:hypothetical protein